MKNKMPKGVAYIGLILILTSMISIIYHDPSIQEFIITKEVCYKVHNIEFDNCVYPLWANLKECVENFNENKCITEYRSSYREKCKEIPQDKIICHQEEVDEITCEGRDNLILCYGSLSKEDLTIEWLNENAEPIEIRVKDSKDYVNLLTSEICFEDFGCRQFAEDEIEYALSQRNKELWEVSKYKLGDYLIELK